jgi:hypothetical protein
VDVRRGADSGEAAKEIVSVEAPDKTWVAHFISFSPGLPNNLLDPAASADSSTEPAYQVFASSEDSRVVVIGSGGSSSLVVETRLPGALPGRLMIAVKDTSRVRLGGLDLARMVWALLRVKGGELP